MDSIGTPKALTSLTVKFDSSTAVLTKVTIFGVVVGATVLAAEVDVED